MFWELVTAGTHGQRTALFKCYCAGQTFFKKVAFTKEDNALIENEKNGYDWYYSSSPIRHQIHLIRDWYFEINIPIFVGRCFSPSATVNGNERAIESIVDWYIQRWRHSNSFMIHGDMALCNIILSRNGKIHIVDWEHSHRADPRYFGFDIINMLFITMYSRYRAYRIRMPGRRQRSFIKSCCKTLADAAGSDNWILDQPFQSAQKYLRRYHDKFSLRVPIEHKFLLASYPSDALSRLDRIIIRS